MRAYHESRPHPSFSITTFHLLAIGLSFDGNMLSRYVRATSTYLLQLSRKRIGVQSATQYRAVSSDPADYFHYSRAVFGSLSPSFVDNSLRHEEPDPPIDIQKAIRDHEFYVNAVKELVPQTVQIPAEDSFPDMVFVEDPAVVLDGRALITKMGPSSRAAEIKHMRPVLEEMGLDIVTVEDPDAIIDGGDVMFTGREFLVGLSRRTNKAGIDELRRAFPEWAVTGITVSHPILHLKSMSSMCGVDTIAIGDSESGQRAWKEIETLSHFKKYKRVVFPDNNGANCLFINGTVMHPPEVEYPNSYRIWQTIKYPRVELPNSELAKADGSLTCNSIRIQ